MLHRIPLPWHVERLPDLHLSTRSPRRAPHASGIRGHQLAVEPRELVTADGVPTTSVERTCRDLSTVLHFYDLIAAGDFLIHRRSPLTTANHLGLAVARRTSGRGVRLLARCLPLLNDASESPPESMLRVILNQSGAPALRVNQSVTDEFGEFVGRTDIIVDQWRLILEYQGDYHRTTRVSGAPT